MKKVIFTFAIVASLVACGSGETTKAVTTDSTSVDSVKVDSVKVKKTAVK